MYNYTTELILNDLTKVTVLLGALTAPASGVPWDPGIEATKKALSIQRLNKYLVAGTSDAIVNSAVYKRAYTAPVNAIASVTVPTTVSGTLYRIALELTTNGYAEAMFARDRVLYGKPFYVEFLGTGTAATDAATVIASFNKVTASYDNFVVASSGGGAVVTMTGDIPQIVIKTLTVESMDLTANTTTVVATGSTTTAPVLPYGNYDDLIRNHRLPTLENFRPFGLNQDELPIVGATYDSYEFQYKTDRGVMDHSFTGGTGQSLVNVVIWVNKSAANVTRHLSGTSGQTGSYTFEMILKTSGLSTYLISTSATGSEFTVLNNTTGLTQISITPPTEA